MFFNEYFNFSLNIKANATALIVDSKAISYAELKTDILLWEKLLSVSYEISSSDTVGILLSSPESFPALLLTLIKLNVNLLLIDPAPSGLVTTEKLEDLVKKHHARFIITDKELTLSVSSVAVIKTDALKESGDIKFNADVCEKQIKESELIVETLSQEGEIRINCKELAAIFSKLDQFIQPADSDLLCFSTDLPLVQLVCEMLWAISQKIPFVLKETAVELNRYLACDAYFPMNFTLFYFGDYAGNENEFEKYNFLQETVKYADLSGYEAVWTPERHFNPFGGLFPNPSILSAALAMITESIQLRSGSIVAPLHHAARISEDWSIIDNLSKGRVALSIGSGWQANDFIFYPDNYASRHEIMLSQIHQIRKLWRGDSMEFKNGMGNPVPVKIFPRPIQKDIPIWVTVSGKTETFVDAGKIGANILTHLLWQDPDQLIEKIRAYKDSLRDNGFSPERHRVSLMLHTFVGADNEEIKKKVKAPLKAYIRSSVHLIEAMVNHTASGNGSNSIGRYGKVDEKIPEHLLEELLEIAFHRFFETAALLGDQAKCQALIHRLKEYGVNELACLIDFGLDKDAIMESLTHLTSLKSKYAPKTKISIFRGTGKAFAGLEASVSKESNLNNIRKILLSEVDETMNFSTPGIAVISYSFPASHTTCEISVKENLYGCNNGSGLVAPQNLNSIINEDF